MPPAEGAAFAPGRANLIGEHTDYNGGLALAFAIREGITARARALDDEPARAGGPLVRAIALDLGESDEFPLADPPPASGWRAFVRGCVAELAAAGHALRPAAVEFGGDVPAGAGLSSSAALELSLCLALLDLARAGTREELLASLDRTALARVAQRVENEWVGAHTGLLDQLASLEGAPDSALLIDFAELRVERVPLRLREWRLVVVDSGETHALGASGYNARRRECTRARELLGVRSLSEATEEQARALPAPLDRRALHVIGENERVRATVAALNADDVQELGELLNRSHASLRDLYEVSTPAVEAARRALLDAGAVGARIVGGGFGGAVLGLLGPGSQVPAGAREIRPGPGAHLL